MAFLRRVCHPGLACAACRAANGTAGSSSSYWLRSIRGYPGFNHREVDSPEVGRRMHELYGNLPLIVLFLPDVGYTAFPHFVCLVVLKQNGLLQLHRRAKSEQAAAGIHRQGTRPFAERAIVCTPAANEHRHMQRQPLAPSATVPQLYRCDRQAHKTNIILSPEPGNSTCVTTPNSMVG